MKQEVLEKTPVTHRVVEHAFKADCTLYLEDETLQRKTITGGWCSPRRQNRVEWEATAEFVLAWYVGLLHLHDPGVQARVAKHVVHHWTGGPQQ
jgi:hypothetical protein